MSDRAANVIEALARVIDDMPGIGKNDDSSQGYRYRGIEAITREVQQLLGRHGVVFVPHVLDWQTDQLSVNNKPWTDTRLKVEYEVFGPGGVEDRIVVGPICAIGRDNSDKGANKAMTQAFKYALLQTLCIGDAKDDGDQASHEADNERDEAPCSLCGELVPGARSDKEPMRQHRVQVHGWARRDDGTVAPPTDPSGETPSPVSPDAPSPTIPSHGEVDDAAGTETQHSAAASVPAAPTIDPKWLSRIQGRLDKLPDEIRRASEDRLVELCDGRFPNELVPGDVPTVNEVVDDGEKAVKPGSDLVQRAARRAGTAA